MKPITFACEATLALPPDRIAQQLLDLDRWPSFEGYGPLPGVRAAAFEARTPEVVGTRIRVRNTDGSTHLEEVVEWEPCRRIRLRMGEFSPPLSRLAAGFDETFEFEPDPTGGRTKVVRRFELHPRRPSTRPLLWLISLLLRRAIDRHLRQMRADADRLGPEPYPAPVPGERWG